MALTSTGITKQEQTIREQAYVATVANLRLEDLHLDEEARGIFRSHADGKIDDHEFSAAIGELNERRFGPVPVSGNGRSPQRPWSS